MTRTEELLALAEAATISGHKDAQGWYEIGSVLCETAVTKADAAFISRCTPGTIKQLVELCRLQNAAMKSPSGRKYVEAIAAFNKFEGGE